MTNTLLNVRDLKTYFNSERGEIPAVNGVSFKVKEGEVVALVGESGSGKSVTSLSIMRLIESPGRIVNGEILFNDIDLVKASDREILKIRGNEIAMIFQDPLSSLNPVFTIGNQVDEMIRNHQSLGKEEVKNITINLLDQVGISDPRRVYRMYPHLLSGGMRQRVMIAMALSCNPKLLIADEPTTALDVTIQAQILRLMGDLTKEYNTSILMITHDMGVVAEIADRVLVMYGGEIVEEGDVFTLFKDPKHPYTKGLLNSVPKPNHTSQMLESIEGNVPAPNNLPSGCAFHPRCKYATDECVQSSPPTFNVNNSQFVKCWLYKS